MLLDQDKQSEFNLTSIITQQYSYNYNNKETKQIILLNFIDSSSALTLHTSNTRIINTNSNLTFYLLKIIIVCRQQILT